MYVEYSNAPWLNVNALMEDEESQRCVADLPRTMRPSVVWRHWVNIDCRDAPVDVSGV
jgi:hypothetical protein